MSNESEYLREIAHSNNPVALAQAIVDEMIARGVGGGSGGNAAPQEISTALGTLDDDTANYLSGGYNTRAPWSLISLVRGLINRFDQLLNGYGTFRTVSDVCGGTIQDFSGVISNANASIQASGNVSRKWLLIQNHGFLNNATEQYEGDLWINIGFSAFDPAFPDSANIGAGSIKLPPGATFRSESSISPYGCVYLLGTHVGIQYTIKEIQ